MYVRPFTTVDEIECEIERCENELKDFRLTALDRQALHDEIDYLESFLPKEVW